MGHNVCQEERVGRDLAQRSRARLFTAALGIIREATGFGVQSVHPK